jgi:hypothetical protein
MAEMGVDCKQGLGWAAIGLGPLDSRPGSIAYVVSAFPMDQFGALAGALGNFLDRAIKPGPMAPRDFVILAGLIGAGLVTLDACCVRLWDKSFLELTHGWQRTPMAILVWAIGAVLAAYIGIAVNIFQPTSLSALAAAVSWRGFITAAQRLAQPNQRSN